MSKVRRNSGCPIGHPFFVWGLHRNARIPFDLAQDHVGLRAFDGGEAEQEVFEKAIIGGDVAAEDAHLVVGLSGGGIAFQHLGAVRDGFDELGQLFLIVTRKLHLHQRLKAVARLGRGHIRAVAFDHAGVLERFHPSPAGGGGHAGPLCQIGVRDAAVTLQQLQYLAVAVVKAHLVRHFIDPLSAE